MKTLEERKATKHAYYIKNKDRISKAIKEWSAKNKDRNKARYHRIYLEKTDIIKTRSRNRLLNMPYKGKLYKSWLGMKTRCSDKNKETREYRNYFLRGISVCSEWINSYENFRNDMEESFVLHYNIHGSRQTTLDRINNNAGYSKDNCRWATYKVQLNNKRQVTKKSLLKPDL